MTQGSEPMRHLLKVLVVLSLLISHLAVAAAAGDEAQLREAAELRQRGRQDEAYRIYRSILNRHPKSAAAHRGACELLREGGEHEDAVAECEAALELAETPENQAALAAALAT